MTNRLASFFVVMVITFEIGQVLTAQESESALAQGQVEDSPDPTTEHEIRELAGFTLYLNKKLLREGETKAKTSRMLELMQEQLNRVNHAVPAKALDHLQSVKVWINPPYENVRPTAEYHPGRDWLEQNDRNPEMVGCIEITNVQNFEFECTRMPWLMLHELSHAYHDQVLGFRNERIRDAFSLAERSGVYDHVDRFTGREIIKDKAYALTNANEYFAETTEAFFGKNDFFPFDRDELKRVDPTMHDLLGELWGVTKD